MKNQDTRLTPEQRIAHQARVVALRAEANAIAKALREDETTYKAKQLPAKEAETLEEEVKTTEEVAETLEEEVKTTEEVEETSKEEVKTTEEVEETSKEEEETTKEVEETPKEEEETTEEVEETPKEEEETTEEVEETPKEEEETTEEVEETSEEEQENDEQNDADSDEENEDAFCIGNFFKKFVPVIGVIALVGILIMLILMYNAKDNINEPASSNPGVVDTNDQTGNPDVSKFDMDTFVASVTKIAKEYTNDENIGSNADICCNNIGENELKKLIETYDEITVQNGIATILAFGAEAKMQQYINNNGLDYNPNAVNDYSDELKRLDDAYKSAKGKNPDGALMSLEGYDAFNGNRDALRKLITDSGDMDLLTWYNAKMNIYDTMRTQTKDTNAALAYKKTVETEILKSAGFAKLLKLQLEKEAAGTLSVVDNASMSYTEDYYNFILNNYIYIVAG